MVLESGMKTSSAAKLLKVKSSSAKMILKKLKQANKKSKTQSNSKEEQPEQNVGDSEHKREVVI